MRRFQRDETGYQKIQGTKPQTLAYALQVRALIARAGCLLTHAARRSVTMRRRLLYVARPCMRSGCGQPPPRRLSRMRAATCSPTRCRAQDSPSGLAAWIVEKFHGWTDCKRSPEEALSKDEMLTNICIYWFGGRIGSSMRLYKESLANK